MTKKIALIMATLATVSYADGFSKTIYVDVKRSDPVYSQVTEYHDVEKCQDVKEDTTSNVDTNNIVGTVIGGAIGGIVGHQFGGGRGKSVATVGGAILGSMAGNKATSSDEPKTQTYQVVRKCEIIKVPETKTIISGYENKGYLDGTEISYTSSDKIKSIPVNVTYSY